MIFFLSPLFEPSAAESFTAVHSMLANNIAGGWDNFTARQMVPAADLLDMSGTQMRITMVTNTGSSTHLAIDKAFVGPKGSGTWDLSSKTQIFWNGGSPSFDIIGNSQTSITSDAFTFSYDGTHDLVFMFYFNASAPSNVVMGPVGGTARVGQKSGGDDTANLVASGYTLSTGVGNVDELVHLIEVA